MTKQQINRRALLRNGLTGAALSAAALAVPGVARTDTTSRSPESAQVAEIYQLQAAFHRAKTTQDVGLMMSLWAPDGTLNVQGDPSLPYTGTAALRGFWQNSGSFTHRRFSLVPSFKTQIDVHGAQAQLYFECHDIGDYDLGSRFIAADTFLAGTVRNLGGNWGLLRHDRRQERPAVGRPLLLPLTERGCPEKGMSTSGLVPDILQVSLWCSSAGRAAVLLTGSRSGSELAIYQRASQNRHVFGELTARRPRVPRASPLTGQVQSTSRVPG